MSMHSTPFGRDSSISEKIILAVAKREGVDPVELSVPLYDAIEVDALNKLAASEKVSQITFTYLSYEIAVSADGTVGITE